MRMFSFKKENVVYFPGCKTSEEQRKNYENILKKLNVNFVKLDFNCCGLPARNLGYEEDFRKQARKNLEFFKENKIDKIIVSCPVCFSAFKEYRKILPDWAMEVEFITKTIADKISKLETSEKIKIGFHRCCYSDDENAEKILENLNYEIIRIKSCCCQLENKELSKKILDKIIRQAKGKVDKIITNCPHCFLKLKNKELPVQEFSEDIMEVFGLL